MPAQVEGSMTCGRAVALPIRTTRIIDAAAAVRTRPVHGRLASIGRTRRNSAGVAATVRPTDAK